MDRLENNSYDDLVAHLEKELELTAVEESDDLPIANGVNDFLCNLAYNPSLYRQATDITCNYFKEKGHTVKDCNKLKKKEEKDAQQGKITQKKTYPKGGTCGKTKHPEERCWQGAGEHLKTKRTRPEDSSDNDPGLKAPKPQYNYIIQHRPTRSLHPHYDTSPAKVERDLLV